MSAWVITSLGVVSEYPASKMKPQTDGSVWLYNAADTFVAIAPKDSVVSFCEPRQVRSTNTATLSAIEAAAQITEACCERLEWRHRHLLAALKRKLANYDARTFCWKD